MAKAIVVLGSLGMADYPTGPVGPGTGTISALVATGQNIVTGINNLSRQLTTFFPQASAVSSAAPSAGTITFGSSQASGFLAVTTSSGAVFRVALYPSS